MKPSYSTIGPCLDKNNTCVMSYSIFKFARIYTEKKLRILLIALLPDVITKSYPELKGEWIANASKMAVNVRDKFELENFRPTAAI